MSIVTDLLPRPPKKWPLLLGLAAAYFGAKTFAPKLFEVKKIQGNVVVTGGGSGIGRLMALRCAKEGAGIAIVDLNLEAAQAVADECAKMGVVARAYKCNVARGIEVERMAEQVLSDFEHIDIVINNAGIVREGYLTEVTNDSMKLVLEVNTLAILMVTKAFLPGMIDRDKNGHSGHIVVIASSAGRVGVPRMASYSASKFGAVGAGEAIRLELKKLGCKKVGCTLVCPSYIKTDMFKDAKLKPRFKFLEPAVEFLMPLLEAEHVANEVIDAVKRDQPLLVLPAFGYTSTILQAFLPVWLTDEILDILGANNSMDDFVQTRGKTLEMAAK